MIAVKRITLVAALTVSSMPLWLALAQESPQDKTLRQFKGKCSLATYLTVIARRTCVHDLARRAAAREADAKAGKPAVVANARPHAGLESLEEVAE